MKNPKQTSVKLSCGQNATFFFKFLLLLISVHLSSVNSSLAQFQQVGASVGSVPTGVQPMLASNPFTGEPYVAYDDASTNSFVILKYDGTSWIQIGSLGFASTGNTAVIKFNKIDNRLYAAYADGALNKFVVMKYDGTSWSQVGAALGFASNNSVPAFLINQSNGDMYMAYADGSLNSFVVRKFDGTAWVQLGASIGFASSAAIPTMAIDTINNQPYIAYREGANSTFGVRKYFAGSWLQVGTINASAASGSSPVIDIDGSTPYVAYVDNVPKNYKLSVFDGTNWTQLGTGISGTGNGGNLTMVVNKVTHDPYIGYRKSTTNSFNVQEYTTLGWVQQGSNFGFAPTGGKPSFEFNAKNNEFYFAYADGASHKVVILKDPSTFFLLPVKFTRLNVTCSGYKATINWAVAEEINSGYYTVQGSSDARNFIDIGKVTSSPGGVGSKNYTYSDNHFNADRKYYRIKETDQDGKFMYSEIVQSSCTVNASTIIVFPNPAVNKISVTGLPQNANIIISNAAGIKVYSSLFSGGTQVIDVSKQPAGFYTISASSGANVMSKDFIIKR